VAPASAVALLRSLVDGALAAAKSPGEDTAGHTWQPWADWQVREALMLFTTGSGFRRSRVDSSGQALIK
jgi:hypothetical protein